MIKRAIIIFLATAVAVYILLLCPPAGAKRIASPSRPKVSCTRISENQASGVRLSGARRRTGKLRGRTLIGNIVNTNAYEGCACRFQLPSEGPAGSSRYFFIADQSTRAWMNIAGEDCELRLIGADHMGLKSKKGQSAYFRFVAPGVEVRVRMLVTRTSTYDVDYEPARYAIAVQVVKGNHRQTVRTTGSCGC